jgi:hypothetical protein
MRASSAAPLPTGVRGFTPAEADFRALNRKEYAVLFSTSHGEGAIDSTDEGISPFTKAFLLALGRETSFVPAMLLTKRITEEITKGAQSPDVQIKWNGDLVYAKSSSVNNVAEYELNNSLPAASFVGSSFDLAKMTTKSILERTSLNLKREDFATCDQDIYKAFFWYSDVQMIEYCYLKVLGYKPSPSAEGVFLPDNNRAVYNTGSAQSADWKFDLDFGGRPQEIAAEFGNADMSLKIKNSTGEYDFRGLVGPNIKFIGLYDFNKDGILDVFLIYGERTGDPDVTFDGDEDELLILDGCKIAKDIKSTIACPETLKQASPLCANLFRLRQSMKDSSFVYDLDKGYYGADLLEIALYADWNVKEWSLDEEGALHLVTYTTTWPQEQIRDRNFMVDKTVKFDPASQNLNITLQTDQTKTITVAPIEARLHQQPSAPIAAAPIASAPVDAGTLPDWCRNARTAAEKLICTTPQLAGAEITMDGLFSAALKRAGPSSTLKRRGVAWMMKRIRCGALPTDSVRIACIAQNYDEWIAELKQVP